MSKRLEDLDKYFQATPVKTEDGLTWHTVNAAPFAVVGVHLTDLGFRQMADGVTPVLKQILQLK